MNGIGAYSKISQDLLVAAYGNDIVNILTGLGYGLALNPIFNVEFDNFLSSLFFQNYTNTPLSFNGSVWSRQHLAKVPLSKYIKSYGNRLYLGFIKIGLVEYPSRVWYCDLPVNDTVQWGYELGTNLTTTVGSNLVGSANAGFKTYNIKRGDPFFILSGTDLGQYSVDTVVSDQQIILADYNGNPTTLRATASGISYWVGGNWFDVNRDDGDFLTGLENNFSQLIVFKRESLHRYANGTQSQVKDAPGTTSTRSIINIRDWTVYFYGGSPNQTGFYAYDSTDGVKISNGIQKYVDGIIPGNYTKIVGWREGQLARWFVGDINNADYGLSVSNAVITLDYPSKAWSVDPIADIIYDATEFRQAGSKSSFIAADTQVFQTPSGNTFNSDPISFNFVKGDIYPTGTEFSNTFTRVQIISENAIGVRVYYRRKLKPYDSDIQFRPLGNISGDSTWLTFPEEANQSSGIDLKFEGIENTEPTAIIKKFKLFFVRGTTI